jgi:DNA-binding CsgD family transcriptional regulator
MGPPTGTAHESGGGGSAQPEARPNTRRLAPRVVPHSTTVADPSPPAQPDAQPRDDHRLLELIGDTQGLVEIDEFRHELVHALRRAVPADWVSLDDVGPAGDTITVIIDPPIDPAQHSTFARHAHQNPLVEHYNETHDGRALRISDVVTQDEFQAREIYTVFYEPIGVEHQLAFTLPHTKDRILGVVLSRNRSSPNFSDEERDLIEQARPFLIQAYRNAIRYSELVHSQRPAEVVSQTPQVDSLVALGLTNRQADVLRLLATGASERDIADRLAISLRTVQKHLERCYRCLGVTNRSRAAAIAWATIDSDHPRERRGDPSGEAV